MATSGIPAAYLDYNTQQSKNVVVVVKIKGVPDVLCNQGLFTRILYGDTGVTYGMTGLVYGGLRPYVTSSGGTFKPYISDQAALSLQQKLETEQGKASVSTVSIDFIDYNGYMTELCSPGQVIPDILGAECEIWLGFQSISYPQDFFRLFRGYVSAVSDGPGSVTLQISDPQLKMRTNICQIAQTQLSSGLGTTDPFINVVGNQNFFAPIKGPDGTYSKSVHCYVGIDQEWIEAVPVVGPTTYGAYIQGNLYRCTGGSASLVTVQYTGGGTAGSEVVSVTGTNVLVTLQSGVSTATQVAAKINASAACIALGLTATVFSPEASSTQTAVAQTAMTLAYAAQNIAGVQYVAASGAPLTIAFANTVSPGSEYATVSGTAITVNISSGHSTAAQVVAALNAISGTLSPLLSWSILPNQDATVQSTLGATALVAGLANGQLAVIARGQQGSANAAHSSGATVSAAIQIGDDTYTENAIDMALKVMLSGWNGDWTSGVAIAAITAGGIQLPSLTDAVRDYGLVAGDYVTVSGSGIGGNNQTGTITGFSASSSGQTNDLIQVSWALTAESPSSATLGFRSQYDVYPEGAGLALTPADVDIAQFQYIKRVFMGTPGNELRFFITQTISSAKDWIGQQILFPCAAYPVTRRGLISVGYNKPPIADQSLTVLDGSNVRDPDQIRVVRALNNRSFFNEVDISYDPDASGNYQRVKNVLDSDSLSTIGVNTPLPIQADGVRYSSYIDALLTQRAQFYLSRFSKGASTFQVKVNWETGSVLEAGDIVTFADGGELNIANFSTGARGLDDQLFEIVDRTFNIKDGFVTLGLLGGVGATASDRFATVSPSSVLGSGNTTTQLVLTDSYGALYPGAEWKKWVNYVGMQVLVHSRDYSVQGLATIQSIDSANPYVLHLSSALGFTPSAGYVLDIAPYPNTTNKNDNSYEKLIHAFLDPSVAVASGVDASNFTVGGGDVSKFAVGMPVRVRNSDYSLDSGDLTVKTISGSQITTSAPMGFVPTSAFRVELIGFPDGGQPYRLI